MAKVQKVDQNCLYKEGGPLRRPSEKNNYIRGMSLIAFPERPEQSAYFINYGNTCQLDSQIRLILIAKKLSFYIVGFCTGSIVSEHPVYVHLYNYVADPDCSTGNRMYVFAKVSPTTCEAVLGVRK